MKLLFELNKMETDLTKILGDELAFVQHTHDLGNTCAWCKIDRARRNISDVVQELVKL